jgi:8-oxo-dGTP diphosphatase
MLIIPHLILRKDDKILLTRRATPNKIWAGHWHLVTGSIEQGESPKEAIIREAKEEIGIVLSDSSLVTIISINERDYFDSSKRFYSVELFFLADLPAGQEPFNAEPLKQDAMGWFTLLSLPSPMIPGVKFGLEAYFNNLNYAEFSNDYDK